MTRITKAPDVRRSELIATAQHLFYTKGYERTSVSDIVKAVGVAKGTFYYYFETKMAVLEALIEDINAQSVAILREIVADDSLSALDKWHKAFQTTAAWKTDHKEELMTVIRVMFKPENIMLNQKITTEAVRVAAPEIAKIIAQGVKEGVFDTQYPEESAKIAYTIMQSVSTFFADLVLHPDQYDNRSELVRRKMEAVQTAVERVLGAPSGSLRLIDAQTIAAWFE